MGPSSHEKLTKTVMEKQLLNNLSQISKQTHATLFEVFHGSKIPYLPKSVFYEKEKTFTWTQLATLDHNNNMTWQQVFGNPNTNWTQTITCWIKYNYSGAWLSIALYITTLSPEF